MVSLFSIITILKGVRKGLGLVGPARAGFFEEGGEGTRQQAMATASDHLHHPPFV